MLGFFDNWQLIQKVTHIELDTEHGKKLFPWHGAEIIQIHPRIRLIVTKDDTHTLDLMTNKPLRFDIYKADESDLLVQLSKQRILGNSENS